MHGDRVAEGWQSRGGGVRVRPRARAVPAVQGEGDRAGDRRHRAGVQGDEPQEQKGVAPAGGNAKAKEEQQRS